MPSLSDQPGLSGLAEDDAQQRLARQGRNEIDDRERQGWLDTLRGMASEPMFLLLTVGLAVHGAIALPVTWHCWQRGDWIQSLLLAVAQGLAVKVSGAQRLLQFAQPATADLLLALGWVAGAVALGAYTGAATLWRRAGQPARSVFSTGNRNDMPGL